jgi:hypothetical protein
MAGSPPSMNDNRYAVAASEETACEDKEDGREGEEVEVITVAVAVAVAVDGSCMPTEKR